MLVHPSSFVSSSLRPSSVRLCGRGQSRLRGQCARGDGEEEEEEEEEEEGWDGMGWDGMG